MSEIKYVDILDFFIENNLHIYNGNAVKVYLLIAKKTLGSNKESEYISYGELKDITGLSINSIKDALRTLLEENMIFRNLNKFGYKYSVNPNVKDLDEHDIDEHPKNKSTNQREINYKYTKWRKDVLMSQNYTCQHCYSKERALHVHHIKPYANNEDLRYDIDNGLVLCSTCHIQLHKEMRKENE